MKFNFCEGFLVFDIDWKAITAIAIAIVGYAFAIRI